jgi:acyl carrier protein
MEIDDSIRSVLAEFAKLAVDVSTLSDDDDIFDAGMTSHASVNVVLALEEAFDIEFPQRMLRRSTFESVSAIRGAVMELVGSPAP